MANLFKQYGDRHLVVTPAVDHWPEVPFQNTHTGIGAGHEATAVAALPSHSTVVVGPSSKEDEYVGQRNCRVSTTPGLHEKYWVIYSGYRVVMTRGGCRRLRLTARSLPSETSIWPVAVVVMSFGASEKMLLVSAQGRLPNQNRRHVSSRENILSFRQCPSFHTPVLLPVYPLYG